MTDLFGDTKGGIGRHHSASALREEWLTPPEIIDALGKFDLDPCAPISPPWTTATESFCILDDGLSRPWTGRVWLNPPYGGKLEKWLCKMAEHGHGIALIFARTETDAFHRFVWNSATAILFIRGRLHFHHVDGSRAKANAGAPSCLIAYGETDADILKNCGIKGHFVEVNQ